MPSLSSRLAMFLMAETADNIDVLFSHLLGAQETSEFSYVPSSSSPVAPSWSVPSEREYLGNAVSLTSLHSYQEAEIKRCCLLWRAEADPVGGPLELLELEVAEGDLAVDPGHRDGYFMRTEYERGLSYLGKSLSIDRKHECVPRSSG